MIVKVHMLAFGEPGEIREVEVPDEERSGSLLDQVFYFGQNDFQPQRHPSVSVGDVIEVEDRLVRYHVVAMSGFTPINLEQFNEFKALPQQDRHFHKFCTGRED
ncbi:MAG: hypothetical protein M0R80_23600 [Proteobacteria bacterium]|nr:hypothetical protein [Pseudomonadota bacterium]